MMSNVARAFRDINIVFILYYCPDKVTFHDVLIEFRGKYNPTLARNSDPKGLQIDAILIRKSEDEHAHHN
jgi:hypothetical protein